MEISLPKKTRSLFGPERYKIIYGGRDSSKTTSVIIRLIIKAREKKIKVLCCREFQNSIKDSVKASLDTWIDKLKYSSFFKSTQNTIIGSNGSEFIFHGLRNNVEKIKSLDGVDICYVEEATTISQKSWDVLIPTIRKEESEIYIVFNPSLPSDPVYKMFVENKRPNSKVIKINYNSNPFLTKESKEEINYLKNHDYKKYLHIYKGEFLDRSEKAVFQNFEIGATPEANQYYYGMDFGYAIDPTTVIKFSMDTVNKIIYVHDEVYKTKVEIDSIPELIRSIDGAKDNYIVADNSRPETISYLNRNGFYIKSSKKGPGSILEGVEFIKYHKVIINPKCRNTIFEFSNYSYETDSLTGMIKPTKIEDKHNHCIDAIRYGLELIRATSHFTAI